MNYTVLSEELSASLNNCLKSNKVCLISSVCISGADDVNVSDAEMFEDIGVVAHIKDPVNG